MELGAAVAHDIVTSVNKSRIDAQMRLGERLDNLAAKSRWPDTNKWRHGDEQVTKISSEDFRTRGICGMN